MIFAACAWWLGLYVDRGSKKTHEVSESWDAGKVIIFLGIKVSAAFLKLKFKNFPTRRTSSCSVKRGEWRRISLKELQVLNEIASSALFGCISCQFFILCEAEASNNNGHDQSWRVIKGKEGWCEKKCTGEAKILN